MELGWGSVRGVCVLFCVLVLRGIIQAPVCGHPPGCSRISSAQGVCPHGVTTTFHISVTTSRHNASPAAPGAASANRVYSMPFPVRLPKSGACSLPEALVQLLSKPCASRGGWTPSVYPLKYVLGFQVNVCNFFFPYMNKFGFDFFFLQRIKCKKFVLWYKLKFVTRNTQIEDTRGQAQGRNLLFTQAWGLPPERSPEHSVIHETSEEGRHLGQAPPMSWFLSPCPS